MALVGFVGPGHDGDVRLYPDIDFQRWMDFRPTRSSTVLRSPTPAGGRTVIWVNGRR